jgi:hypothetical protein
MKLKISRSITLLALVLICCLWGLTNSEADETLNPKDFAYGMSLEWQIPSSLYITNLSEPVYLGSVKKDHSDLRIFNGDELMVPFTLRHPSQTSKQIKIEPLEVSPISEKSKLRATITEHPITVKSANNKGSVNIQISNTESSKTTDQYTYLIDLRKNQEIQRYLKSITFDWDTKGETNPIIHLEIEASDDLNNWVSVVKDAVILKLAYQNQNVLQNKVEFTAVKLKFLKITFKSDLPFNLKTAQGEFISEQRVVVQSWKMLEPIAKAKDEKPNELQYDAKGYFPVDRLTVNIPENTFMELEILSRNEESQDWVPRYLGSVYHLLQDHQTIVSQAITLPMVVSDKYWLIRAKGKDVDFRSKSLNLVLGYVPHELIFLAQGQGPFLLAFGNATASPPDFGFNPTSNLEHIKANALKPAILGPQIILGGPDKLIPPPPPKPWKQWLLWAVLVVTLLVLARMSWTLYKTSRGSWT